MIMPGRKLRLNAEKTADRLPDLMIRAEKAAQNIFLGEHPQRKSGAGEKFWQFREYTPQDRPQDIDWRQSGKTDSVFIRQKERQLPQTALFWCEQAGSMHFSSSPRRPKKSESAQILLLALAIILTRSGERVGALGSSRTGRSEAALEAVGRSFLNTSLSQPFASLGIHKARKGAAIIMAGDFLQNIPDIKSTLNGIATPGSAGLLIQVLDPAEIDLPWRGRVIFEDTGPSHRETVQNVSSIREAYRAKIQNHRNEIERLCRAQGWSYILHTTDQPPEKTLEKIYATASFVNPAAKMQRP